MAFLVCVYHKDSCWQLVLDMDSSVTIGASDNDTLPMPESGLRDSHISFVHKESGYALTAKEGVFLNGTEVTSTNISVGDILTYGDIQIYIAPKQPDYERSVNMSENKEFLIGRSRECTFCLSNQRVGTRHAKIIFESGKYKLVDLDSKNHTYINGKQISTHYLCDGDVISIVYYSIVFENGELSFFNTGNDIKINLAEKNMLRRYPLFRRSPRLGSTHDDKPIEIQQTPSDGEKPQINWLVVALPPLVMVAVAVASMLLSGGGLMTLIFILPMTMVALVTTVISYFSQVRKFRNQQKQKAKVYDDYIKQIAEEIEKAYNRQLYSTNNANPETSYCHEIASNRMRRLWERSASDDDFLDLRLGKGSIPLSTEVILPKPAVGDAISPHLSSIQKIADDLKLVKNIAVTVAVKKARTIGVVGNRQVAVKAIQNSIVQLTTHHSYAEVNLVLISSERDYQKWSWTRWLPHVWDGERSVRYLSSDKRQAAELLSHFEDVLKKRKDAIARERFHGQIMLPYFVFLVTDYSLVENREFLKLVSSVGSAGGASAFLLFDNISKLPKECDIIVDFNNVGGSLYSRAHSANKTSFTLDTFSDYDKFARAMAPIRDRNAAQNTQLPTSVTFFQGYGIKDVSEIQVLQNWNSSRPHKSLAAPIGTKENGKPFLFDLHEKAHGPHGLVAGTTGSGKSEVLQTWILSMCANYSPQDVSFILIDFKGMGLAGTLKALPHIAGVISNVDENIQRNLFSLESELSRRQRLFAGVSTDTMKIGDIYDYQDAYKQGKSAEPLSHLIVVVDEFAELKAQFPDFMAALDRAARVGRSLGVHLVLATQKPDGVVTEEVRANSKFKWCLKVASEQDSKAVISRPEAAFITTPGRTYIQVGNNEIFELVQAYYSGANINKETPDSRPTEVSFVDTVGHREVVSSGKTAGSGKQEKELIALVKHISDAHRASGLPQAVKVWEESLPKRLYLPDIHTIHADGEKPLLSAVIGITDDPRHQKQYPTEIDFATDGHIIIYGAPGTGKTMLLQTLMMSLAERYTPDEVNAYIMDFGSWSMKNLEALPHIGGVANGNEDEKIVNLVKLVVENLNKRKAMFAQVGASNLETYRQTSGKAMPAIFVFVDNFAPIRELYPDIEHTFVRLSREGSSYGIYIVISATSLVGNIGFNLSQNFKQALSLRMAEKADYRDIVGDTDGLEPSKVAGRGLVRGKPPMEFQTALAVKASNDVDYVSKLKKRCEQLASEWSGDVPHEIPVMPDVVLPSHIKNCPEGHLAIGLSANEIAPVCLAPDNRVVLISGMERSGKTNLIQALAKQLEQGGNHHLVFAKNDEDAAKRILAAIRRADGGEQVALLIDDITSWLFKAEYEVTDMLENLIGNIRHNRFTLFATGDALEIASLGHSTLMKMIASNTYILLGGSFSEHYGQFEALNLGYTQQNEQLAPHCGYLIHKRKAVAFKSVLFTGGT